MGKRKSSKPEPKRKRYTLPTEFDCPCCNYSKCVEVKMIKKNMLGKIKCRICSISFEARINPIMEAADLYCVWVDECELLNQKKKKKSAQAYLLNNEDEIDSMLDDSEEEEKFEIKSKKNVKQMLRKRDDFDIGNENNVNRESPNNLKRKKTSKKGSFSKYNNNQSVSSRKKFINSDVSDNEDNFSELKSLKRDNKSIKSLAQKMAQNSNKDQNDSDNSESDSISDDVSEDIKKEKNIPKEDNLMFKKNKRRQKQVISESESESDDDANRSELENELSD